MTIGSHPAPYRIDLVFNRKSNRILLDQSRLLRRLGAVDPAVAAAALDRLRAMFAD
jgi:hypothetical protein